MDAVIDARFERVEKALGALIDSISKYNPSISRVSDLVLADRELQDGLQNVQTHQNNVLRIQKLKATTAGLDAQIRSTLEVLASTRKDMTATPSTVFPDRLPNPISFEELLAFARRISKTTLPPPGVTNGVDLDGTGGDTTPGGGPAILTTGQDAGASTPAGPVPQTPTGPVSVAATPTPMSAVVNGGVGTPAPGTPSNTRQDSAMPDAQPQQGPQGGAANGGEVSAGNDKSVLPELFSQWMNPHTGAIFLPWPHEDQIRMGGLAANQSLSDRGIDPKGHDPAEEERLAAESAAEAKRLEEERVEAERKAMAEREARARQEMERRRAQQREMEQRDALLRGSAGSGAQSPTSASPTVKKQFQFTAFDDDDDSDNSD
ncbi:hypothetical protein GGTG_03389 [Gaeumannomyces tritici R3-111a-1]|uniref:Mediator of RNA polymerase II transcription subunit 4 n=1 Tax=Gaeumannomyces tritici (strain R3-111a-1) TaxID=644352 RepID=J3NQ32_GAET3|nr:hypothetical protein GGTG_03389 [Gaeumannomyces tritici R3-111a-1]EJT78288.1 hypothetical protein GGTG_03389 [Gaeumannomyces tritici R3-111a-1]